MDGGGDRIDSLPLDGGGDRINSLPLDGGGLGVKRGFRGACAEPAERHSACKPMRGAQLEVKTPNTCGAVDAFSPLPNPPRQGEGVKNSRPRQGEGVKNSRPRQGSNRC